jgi:hypothetical protein
MNDPTKWRTRTGEEIEIAWMDSIHLYHSFRMSTNSPINSSIYAKNLKKELDDRGFFDCGGVVIRPARRETPLQMCWMRAVLDTKLDGWASDVRVIREHPDVWSCGHPTIVALATKYRLMRGIL